MPTCSGAGAGAGGVLRRPAGNGSVAASGRAFTDSQWQLDAWVSSSPAIAAGELDAVSERVSCITGHPAPTLDDLLRR